MTTSSAVTTRSASGRTRRPDLDDATPRRRRPTRHRDDQALAASLGEYAEGLVAQGQERRERRPCRCSPGSSSSSSSSRVQNSKFLTAGNLTILLTQGAAFILLGMAEVFVLLLGEIDLSAGFVGAVGAGVAVSLAAPGKDHAWWICILAGLAVCAVVGTRAGTDHHVLRLPSFVVTLAGLLAFQGVLIWYLDREAGPSGGARSRSTRTERAGQARQRQPWRPDRLGPDGGRRRRFQRCPDLPRLPAGDRPGLSVPPFGLVVAKVVALAVAGVVLVLICNTDRGTAFAVVKGVPWVVPIVLAVLALWTFLLDRTTFGRYVYAIGGNAEAARRAGIKVTQDPRHHVRSLQRHRGDGHDRLRVPARARSRPTSMVVSWCCTPSQPRSSAVPASSAGAER